ncbi:hypothetical protein [Exilibacterium tricleocarpae]|nr:hypothetical protein [Exilibacterium tricleocarpae]
MVDALGNNRAFSNDAQYIEWRLANGYYATYSAGQVGSDPSFQAQVDAIRTAHSLTYRYRADGYLTEVTDQQGFKTTYAYDGADNLISLTDRNGDGAVSSDSHYFRELRKELGIVDTAGNGKQVAGLTQADINALIEAFTTHFTYDERGNLISRTDNVDNQVTLTYTDFNTVASSTSAVGNALVSSDTQLYQERRIELGYAASVADLSAADIEAILTLHTTFFNYDANQNLIERRDAGGDITRFDYDAFGNQTRRTVFLDANDLSDPAKQQITQFFYDDFGNNIRTIDAEGNITHSAFDHYGNLTQLIDARGSVTSFTYDADNRLLTVTDPEGHTTINTYDAVGNRISVTDANGQTITRLFDRNNNLLATIDPSVTDPLQDRTTRFEYDVVGNRTAAIDTEGRRTEFTFNTRREWVEVLTAEVADANGDPVRYTTTYAYDGESNRISTTNNRGFTTEWVYTRNNLLLQQTDAIGHITRFEYDANDNQVTIIAGVQLAASKRETVRLRYDEEDQLITQIDAEGNVSRYAYDAPGNRLSVTDGNGNTTEYEYDGNNRLLREIHPETIDPVSGAPVRYTVEHIFDANGNEVETIDENGHSTKFTFDRDNRVVMIEDANGIKTVFEYDSRHNRTAVMIGVEATANTSGQVVISNRDEAQITRYTYDEFNRLIAETDGVGNALAISNSTLYQAIRQELGYAADAADLSQADQNALRNLYTRHYIYDREGNLTSQTDHLGRSRSFAYDALNRIISQQDPLGEVARFAYDGSDNLVKEIDELGRTTTHTYDAIDRQTDTVNAIGTRTHLAYDDFDNVTSGTRAYGTAEARTTSYEYDLNNRIIAETDPEGHRRSFEYDAVGNRIRATDGRNNTTRYFFDALNRNIKVIDPLSFETKFEYDGVGNRLSMTDARGGIVKMEYDPGNRRVKQTDAEGRITVFSFDVRGNEIEMRSAAGTADEQVTTFLYDAEQNLRRVVDAEGGITEQNYDRVYNNTGIIDAEGNSTVIEFDALNRVVRTIDAEQQTTSFVLDAVGNVLDRIDALGNSTRYVYDDNDRIIRQIEANDVETHFSYDTVDNRTRITWAANTPDAVTQQFVYNLDDRLIAEIDGEGNTYSYNYDENHNQTLVTDPNGNTTRYTYDENNRVAQIDDAEGNIVRYVYDANGNRVQVIDGRNQVSTIYYNANNEVSVRVDAEGYARSNSYDNNGNVVSQTLHMQALGLPLDPEVPPALPQSPQDQTTLLEYDNLNRITAQIDAEGYRVEYLYDALGNRLETHRFRDLAGTDVAITRNYYDNVYREVAMLSAEGYLTEITYDAVGNQTSRTVYDLRVNVPADGRPQPQAGDTGRTERSTYDNAYREVERESALGVLTRFEYDARGNRTAIVEAAASVDQRRTEFAYDRGNRLISTSDALGTMTRFALDSNGNIITRFDAFGSPQQRLTAMEYDGNNRLVRETDAIGVVTSFAYDANGNTISVTRADGLAETRTDYRHYDGNNRLIATINGEGERTENRYDGAGNVVAVIEAPGLAEERVTLLEYDRDNRQSAEIDGEGVRTEYRYDGVDNRVEVIEAAGVTGVERHSYFDYDLDNRLIQSINPLGGTQTFDYDVLGNRTVITDENGGIEQRSYDLIGRLTSSLSAGGTLTVNTYDLRNNLLSQTTSFADGTDARTRSFTYDLLDRQIRVTNGNDFSTTTTYDVFGNRATTTRGLYLVDAADPAYDPAKALLALPQTTTTVYDAVDRLISTTDALGNQMVFEYDAVGNRTASIDGANVNSDRRTRYSYDLANRLTEVINPEGGITRNQYDALGQVVNRLQLQSDDGVGNQVWISTHFDYNDAGRNTAEIDGEGLRREFEYDAVGNRILTRFAAGTGDETITRAEFDLNNRITAEIDGEGFRVEHVYDAIGNQIKTTDARNATTRFYYDADNRIVSMLDAEGYIIESEYDASDNQITRRESFTPFAGTADDFIKPTAPDSSLDRTTRFTYDGAGQLIREVDPEGGEFSYTYDAAGNRVASMDALGRQTTFAFDLNNQLISQIDPNGIETRFGYDVVGNQTSIERAANTTDASVTAFVYDLNNRLVQQVNGLGNTEVAVTYDKADNRVSEVDANGNAVLSAYDLNNRTVSVRDGEGFTTHYAYDGRGNQVSITDGRGNVEVRYYDNNDRMTYRVDRQGFVSGFEFDPNGNVTRQTLFMQPVAYPADPAQVPAPTPTAQDQQTSFEYDGLDRLTARVDGEGYRTDYVLDATGNRLQTIQYRDLAGTDTAVRHSFFDRLDREIATVTAEGYLTLTGYDAMGNRLTSTRYNEPVVVGGGLPSPLPGDPGRIDTFSYDAADRLLRRTNALGIHTDFEYDARGNRIATLEAADTSSVRRTETGYNLDDRVISQTNAEGVVTFHELDGNANIIARYEAFGTAAQRVTLYDYDGNDRITKETNALGFVTAMSYDGAGNRVAATRAQGTVDERTELFAYDRVNQLVLETNGEGEQTAYAYDAAGNRISLTQAPGLADQRSAVFEYDRDNRLTVATDGAGVRTEYRYDGADNKVETIQAAGVPGEERHTFYSYDLDNRLVQAVDPIGGTTLYTYDVLGNQTEIVDSNGGVRTNTFDGLGRVLTSLSAGGILTANTYDVFDNLIEVTQSFADGSDARTTRYAYDQLDRQALITDADGFSTSIQHDAFGNQTTVTHGQYLVAVNDPVYDPAKAARAAVQSNAFDYDAADRLTRLTDALGVTTEYGYDAVGNRTRTTEAANSSQPRTTLLSYDLANRLVQTQSPAGGVAINTYDEVGNKIGESILQSDDGTNQVWIDLAFEYDGNNRRITEIDPYGVRTEFEYDALGNEILKRVAAGTGDERVTRAEYDLNNRISAEIDGELNRSEYEYDALGNRIKATDALGRVARFYFNAANKLVSVLDPEGYVNSFAYDSAGNRVGEIIYFNRYTGTVDDRVAPDPTPSVNDRSFTSIVDGNGRIIQRIESDQSVHNYEYDAVGNLIREEQFANSAAAREITYQYDNNNRLQTFTDVDGTITTLTYDAANNKVSESIFNGSDPNTRRTTTFGYDLNNRQIAETFDPDGLNLRQFIEYDLAGNAIANTDANGRITRVEYDLNNRVVRQIDALGNTTSFAYDAVGNQTSLTDGNGNVADFVYDNNNRVVQEISPAVTVYTIDSGFTSLRPTITRAYDAAGNEIQVIDAAGFVTTRYYDSNNRVLAEINGDNALREWTYNAAGEQVGETLYLTRLNAAAQDPSQRPAAPAGISRTTTREYDRGGRVTRIVHPQIEVTGLTGTDANNPSITTAVLSPEERFVYDAFGNQIEIIDRNGNRTVAYYDARDRLVAQVDPQGYLTEFDYDTQDNVVEQRVYTQPLDIAAQTPASRPTVPAGEVYQTSRRYDAASRLVEEVGPQVEVFDPATLITGSERVITRFTYDGVGNLLTRTLAAGSTQAFTEYNYYDALNRRIAVVDGNRVANLFSYDANGNQTQAKRLFNPVAASVDLAGLGGTTDFAALVGSNHNDQQLNRLYDALNRLAAETELMGAGSADDLTRMFGYDANGRRTRAVDEDGFVQQFSYNGAGSLIRSVSPDGSGTVYEYDAAGNQIFAFTGQLDSVPLPAANLEAALGENLTIGWTLPPGANVQSYVVYDTTSRSDPAGYTNRGAVQSTWLSESGSSVIPAANLNPGDTLFFRVVTQDAVGSLTWTAEQSITIPPRLNEVAVAQTAADTLEVTARFDTGVINPTIAFGMPGSTTTVQAMTSLGDGLFRATLSGIANPQELAYRLQWQDAGGASYSSDEIPFEAAGEHLGVTTQLTESTVVVGSETFYRINADTTLPAGFAADLLGVSATWVNTADDSVRGSASVEGADSGLGFIDFPVVIGAGAAPLPAGTYTITLRAVGENNDTILNTFDVTVGTTLLDATERSISWTLPEIGDSQVVIVDGQRANALREGSRLVVDANPAAAGSLDYSAFYGSAFGATHTTTITSTEITETDDSTDPPTVTILGYDLDISAVLANAEVANVSGEVRLAWRTAQSGTGFANDIALTASGDTFATTLALLAAGDYDLKIYYLDGDGNEVVVDWLRINTDTASTSVTDNSVTLTGAAETDGEISLSAAGVITVDPGLYSGPLPAGAGALSLPTLATGGEGGSQQVDGSDTGYFTENRYDALNNLIATNAESGVWREFGVDANGNTLVTRSFGEEGAPDPIVSLAAYDGRNREVARFAPPVNGQRAVTRFEYDVQDNIVREIDPLGGHIRRTWNALGSQLTEQNQLFNTTTFRYDRLGRNTAEIDALGNAQYKFYDTLGNLIQEIDGEGNATTYTYDVFGRRIRMTNALNQSVTMTYDQRDRLVSANDALGHTTTYAYDGRNNRTRTVDANGHESRQVRDGLGRVTDTVTLQNGREIHERQQYDAYGNLVASIDGAGRITTRVFGAFGRLLQQIDAGGRITFFDYDDQGRVSREFAANGKDIRRSYDAAGRQVEVNDLGTGVRTTYTYDLAGKRLGEITNTPGNAHNRDITYQYDAVGQMTRWFDGITGMHTNYQWDHAGNLARAFTDLGYDPDGEGLDANTRFVDHVYSYDANNHVVQQTQRGSILVQYGYDAANNRIMVNNEGTVTEYTFDAGGRVTAAESGGNKTADWQYDKVGNVTRFRTFNSDGSVDKVTTRQYYENNRNFFTNDDGQQTTQTLDDAGNVTRTKLVDDGNTFYFDHIYNSAGQEVRINARGKDASGRTTNTYDVNDNLVTLNKGIGDEQDRAEVQRFVYNNDGQILYRFNDTGNDNDIFETEFAYANRNPVGQTGNTEDAASETLLDTGRYNLVQPLGEDFPNSAVTSVTTSAGDTLQGIAAAVYGNPSLWFVIAEANGLVPGEPLAEGQRLQIPNTVKTGRLTADTHVVYNEGDIIGSTLPNLKSDSKDDGCGSFLAIIIVAVIAVVAIIATAGLATAVIAPALGAIGLSGAALTVASFAIAGAIVGAAAAIVQQGIFIALGYQDDFSWRAVATGAITGALSGAAQGLGKLVEVGQLVGNAAKFAKLSARALQVTSAAVKQVRENDGKITSWASLAAAGLGPVQGVKADGSVGALVDSVATEVGGALGATIQYVTPWLSVAESFVRNEEISAATWASAIGSTLTTGLSRSGIGAEPIFDGLNLTGNQLATNLLVSGGLALFDKEAGEDYIASSIGNEIGTFLGQSLADATGLTALAQQGTAALQAEVRRDQRINRQLLLLDKLAQNFEEIDPQTRSEVQQLIEEGGLLQEILTENFANEFGDGVLGKFNGENIVLDQNLVDRARTDANAAALLFGVLVEEEAHLIAAALEQRLGISDFDLDEGALTSGQVLSEIAAAGNPVLFDLSLDGEISLFAFGAENALNAVDQFFTERRIAGDLQVNGVEFNVGGNQDPRLNDGTRNGLDKIRALTEQVRSQPSATSIRELQELLGVEQTGQLDERTSLALSTFETIAANQANFAEFASDLTGTDFSSDLVAAQSLGIISENGFNFDRVRLLQATASNDGTPAQDFLFENDAFANFSVEEPDGSSVTTLSLNNEFLIIGTNGADFQQLDFGNSTVSAKDLATREGLTAIDAAAVLTENESFESSRVTTALAAVWQGGQAGYRAYLSNSPAPATAAQRAQARAEFRNSQANASTGFRGVSRADKGLAGESAARASYLRRGYTEMQARLARNNGFDGVFVKRARNGRVVDVVISESKFSANGNARMSNTRTMGRQLGVRWINANINNLLEYPTGSPQRATGEFLNRNRNLIRTETNTLDARGNNRWNNISNTPEITPRLGADAARTQADLARAARIGRGARIVGRFGLVFGAGVDAVRLGSEIAESSETGDWSNTGRAASEIAGGWAGAWAGGKVVGAAGASLGGLIGSVVPVLGTATGAVIGGIVGGVIGGALGYFAGSEAGGFAFDQASGSQD